MLREFVDAWSMVKVLDEETREWRGVCDVGHLRNLELRRKVEPDIRPDMPKARVYAELEKASGNADVEKCALLWRLVDEVLNGEEEVSGRPPGPSDGERARYPHGRACASWRRGGTCKR